MNELLAKITDLTYEFFGVFMPGVIGELFIVAWWVALGPLAPKWTYEMVPQLTLESAGEMVESVDSATGFGLALPIIVAAYFIGHIILWIARSGKTADKPTVRQRLVAALTFRILKPVASYNSALEPLFDAVRAKFALSPSSPLTWRQFYPVAKAYLSASPIQSLVATYQTKYTLHRSVATAAAGWFWLNVGGLVGGLITNYLFSIAPHWAWHVAMAVAALVLVWGFAASYFYNWEMFGNTIITETYALVFGPPHARDSE